MDKQLRDKNGKLIGIIRKIADREEIRNAKGHLKGFYFSKLNQTRSVEGKLVGFGNLLTTLI